MITAGVAAGGVVVFGVAGRHVVREQVGQAEFYFTQFRLHVLQ